MNQTQPQLPTVAQNIVNAFAVIRGQAQMNNSFVFSPQGFWQALVAGWMIGVFVVILPSFQMGVHFLLSLALTSLVASLFYALAVWHVMFWSGKGSRYLKFMLPYLWISNLQIVLFGLIMIIGQFTGAVLAQIATIPIVIWILVWLYRTARDQTGMGGFAALGFLAGRFAIEAGLGMLAAGGLVASMG